MGGPGTLSERCRSRRIGGVVGVLANEIVEGALDVTLVQPVAASELDRGARRARGGRTCRLEVDRLRDPEIVALPQRERERTHIECVEEAAGATEDVIAQVITALGGQRGIRRVSASVVLVATKIDEDDGGGVGDGEDLEGPVGHERARETERTALVALDEGAQVSVVLV